jgi:hypothetical protein
VDAERKKAVKHGMGKGVKGLVGKMTDDSLADELLWRNSQEGFPPERMNDLTGIDVGEIDKWLNGLAGQPEIIIERPGEIIAAYEMDFHV